MKTRLMHFATPLTTLFAYVPFITALAPKAPFSFTSTHSTGLAPKTTPSAVSTTHSTGLAPNASSPTTAILPTAVVRPSPGVQPPPISITDLLQIIEGSALGAQFSITNFLGFDLNVALFLRNDEAAVIGRANNATGLNSAFVFHVLEPATPFLVTIQDVVSGSFLSYTLAGTGVTSEFQPAVINANSPVVFEVTHISGTGFTLTELSSNTLLTAWPSNGLTFSPVTYQAMNGLSSQIWNFVPLE